LKILVTGAQGFTGNHFMDCARGGGYDVVALTSDLLNSEALDDEIIQCAPEAVVHLAAISFVGHAKEADFYSVNVLGTLNLLKSLTKLHRQPTRVLLASSANIYGNCERSPIPETQAAAPINHYSTSKLAMEHMVKTYEDRLPLMITRPFNYTGPGQATQFVIPKLVSHFARRALSVELGNLNVEREFNDVSMVCDRYLKLLTHGEVNETYNICSGQPYTLLHVVSLLEKLADHQLEVKVNPAFVRSNEVSRLCGDPSKLNSLLNTKNVMPNDPSLIQTLQQMLHASQK
jgi:GDP-6-deoxy-D-talose 4-dehydrogenase